MPWKFAAPEFGVVIMTKNVLSGMSGLALVVLALFASCSSCATGQTQSGLSAPATTSTAVSAEPAAAPPPRFPTAGAEVSPFPVPYYPPPGRIDLCGEPVPLQVQEVMERFDREFTIIVYNHAQVYLWLKRMERYFPWIEERLRANNLPEDLKYLAIAESDLLPTAASPKGAAGPWQFIPGTGSRYGLDQQGSYDQRYDFEKATESAFRYLNDLHKQFNNWSLAIAAYNCGEKRVQDEMNSQRTSDYYQMKLPLETERYVVRIVAIKAVLSNPARYGYNLPKGLGYQQFRVDRVRISLSQPTSIYAAASAAGVTYREFKRLNPTFRADQIPAGTFEMKVPEGTGNSFQQNLDSTRGQSVAEAYAPVEVKNKHYNAEPAPIKSHAKPQGGGTYTVKKGDTLSSIAQRFKVSADKLRQMNHIKGNTLIVGGKLKIPQM
jgi:membrane-bound lytic murein transglycosylase D